MDEKKSERLEVRLGFQEKSDFVEACDTQGDTPSSALRRFIRGYVRRADADLFASAWRGLEHRRSRVIMGVGGLAAVLLAGWFIMKAESSLIEPTDMNALTAAIGAAEKSPVTSERLTGQAALDAAKAAGPRPVPEIDITRFRALDKNEDGVLARGEILPSDHHLHRLLDIDGQPGISPEEFYVSGTMDYKIAKKWDMKSDGVSQRLAHDGPSDTISVTFDLRHTQPLIRASRPLEDAVIARPDRTVIWAIDAVEPFLVATNDSHPIRK